MDIKTRDKVGKLVSSPSEYPRAYICNKWLESLQYPDRQPALRVGEIVEDVYKCATMSRLVRRCILLLLVHLLPGLLRLASNSYPIALFALLLRDH